MNERHLIDLPSLEEYYDYPDMPPYISALSTYAFDGHDMTSRFGFQDSTTAVPTGNAAFSTLLDVSAVSTTSMTTYPMDVQQIVIRDGPQRQPLSTQGILPPQGWKSDSCPEAPGPAIETPMYEPQYDDTNENSLNAIPETYAAHQIDWAYHPPPSHLVEQPSFQGISGHHINELQLQENAPSGTHNMSVAYEHEQPSWLTLHELGDPVYLGLEPGYTELSICTDPQLEPSILRGGSEFTVVGETANEIFTTNQTDSAPEGGLTVARTSPSGVSPKETLRWCDFDRDSRIKLQKSLGRHYGSKVDDDTDREFLRLSHQALTSKQQSFEYKCYRIFVYGCEECRLRNNMYVVLGRIKPLNRTAEDGLKITCARCKGHKKYAAQKDAKQKQDAAKTKPESRTKQKPTARPKNGLKAKKVSKGSAYT